MGFKDLFIVPENERSKTKKNEPTKGTSKFPASVSSDAFDAFVSKAPQSNGSSGQVSPELMDKFNDMYKKGFDSLNKDGYDFYEYYQAVVHGGVDNPQIYTMAMAMGSAMDKTITKEKLLTQADFYINEINKVYNTQVTSGKSKKQELGDKQENENKTLTADLENLKGQMEALKVQIQDRETKLSQIGNKYQPLIADIEGKLVANDFAKNKIVSSIEAVKNGISNNLK